jgi:hypothetical protein
MAYRVFKRAWWKRNPSWPNGLEPNPGARKTTITIVETEDEARMSCRIWDQFHAPKNNPLSIRAEYERK